MYRMMLDEMISPSLVPALWEEGIDSVHLRDRGLLGATDGQVWKAAQNDHRALVTANRPHFLYRASKGGHEGLLLIPSGTRDEQLGYVRRGISIASANYSKLPATMANAIIDVTETSGGWTLIEDSDVVVPFSRRLS